MRCQSHFLFTTVIYHVGGKLPVYHVVLVNGGKLTKRVVKRFLHKIRRLVINLPRRLPPKQMPTKRVVKRFIAIFTTLPAKNAKTLSVYIIYYFYF